jgi:hypothetical protein
MAVKASLPTPVVTVPVSTPVAKVPVKIPIKAPQKGTPKRLWTTTTQTYTSSNGRKTGNWVQPCMNAHECMTFWLVNDDDLQTAMDIQLT